MSINRNHRLAVLLLALLPGAVFALASDREQPIYISADQVEINQQTGVSVYRGNVEVNQGSLAITAERVVVYRKGQELDHIEATGGPATFRQRPDDAETDIRGKAQRIEYETANTTAVLTGDAYIWRNQDEFRGERIVYDTDRSVVQAKGGEGSRVQAIIHPKKEAPAP